ncbi:MAG: energy transducer TonB [Gemmatimonadetes bacterium]|nr:energy transducer TonB [Gemmatimonadota bacterium]
MKREWLVSVLLLALLVAGCRRQPAPAAGESDAAAADSSHPPFEPPVVTNAESPVRYPPVLFQQNVEGTVLLRLFVDSLGRLAPESTRIAEGSGISGLDSAALASVPTMKFAPARKNGRPIATSFLQPIQFRRPEHRAEESEH